MIKISSFILISVFFVFGCASIQEMNINLGSLKGMKIDRAISILGIGNPTRTIELEYRRIYIWESFGNIDMPIGGYNYGHDQYGNSVSVWDPDQSSTQIPLECKITIYTLKDYKIINSLVEGDGIQCNEFDEELKRAANYIQNNYKNLKTDGPYESYHDNGQLHLKGNYKDGKQDGLWESYYENGQLQGKANYKDGDRHGLMEFYYENGQLKGKGNYKDGKQDGPYESYHDNGQLHLKGNYKDGKQDGLWESYYENGQLQGKANYKDGKLDGPYEMYYDNGQLEQKSNYKDGELGPYEMYYDNGRLKNKGNTFTDLKNNKENNLEEQSEILSQLLEMYEKGLISKTIYELEKKKTLNKN